MNNIFPSNYSKPLFSNLNFHLHQSESNLINIVRNRKNVLSPNNKLLSNNINNNNNKNLSKSKGTQSSTSSSTLSTFRKTSNLYKTSAHNSCTNINKNHSSKHAVNIKANAKEINIHLSLNSDNTNNNNTHNNSSSINIHNNSKCSSTYYEDIIKEQDQHIKQLKHELKEAKQILAAVKEYNGSNSSSNSNNKLHKSYAHKKRHTINNDFNTLLGNTKSSWYVSTKTGNTPTSLLIGNKFGLWDGDNITKRCVSPKGCNNIFFGLREHRKRNWSSNNQDRLKTFSAKTQRTFGKRKGSNMECNSRKNSKKNNNKNINVNDVHLMNNEELVCLCKMMIQRAYKVFGMYNDIIRLNKKK